MHYDMNLIYVKQFESNDLVLPILGIFDVTFEVKHNHQNLRD